MTPKVLIADDEESVLVLLEYLMQGAGYEVCLARDGEEALAALHQQRPSLVILDVMMPKKTGFEVCRALRDDAAISATRVLMLTAKGRDTDVAKGLAVGADAYMTKPFSTRELLDKVREMLGTRH